ncbi:DUF6153 family protein [Nocardia sp. NPDC058658]|uniref:DUF6153 family protein n=1 Tax=Nocardia sp. NPDC058658 TaxID=3346580 RepID=UPI0036466819
MDKHPARAPGIARALAVLMLLAGIVAMHSAVFGTAHAHGQEAAAVPADHFDPAPSATDHHATGDHSAQVSPAFAAPADPHTGCGSAGCDEHSAVHGCVFILAALAIALTLVLLYRLGDTAETARRTPRIWRGSRARPPPWTVLTLSQLAILRI